MEQHPTEAAEGGAVPRDPDLVQELLASVRFAPLWLGPRVVLGWFWLEAGWSQRHGRGGAAIAAGFGEPLAVGLMLAGIALILGVLTGPAAFAGGFLSSSLAAANVVLPSALVFATVVWLTLTWKTAGWIGIDRWLLPALGMPWRSGELFEAWPQRERRRRNGRQS